MYEYLRSVTSKLLVNENKLTVTESLEIGECPDIFLMDYFFLTYVRYSFVDFVFLVFRSLSNISFFNGQTEQFEVTHELPLEFCDWYTSIYPIEKGKSMFYQKKQETMVIKFFGTFTVKDTKLYVTIPDYIMYSFVRLIFYQYLFTLHYHKIYSILTHKLKILKEELNYNIKSLNSFVGENSYRLALIKTWYPNHITRYTDLEESFENLEAKIKNTSKPRDFLNFRDAILESDSTCQLECLFTFYFVNFFLYSLVKDSPGAFFDSFYQNYGFWVPNRYSFQKMLQMEANITYKKILGYSLTDKDKGKWPFSATRRDFFFQWYHDYFYDENPYFSLSRYKSFFKKNYSNLIKVSLTEETLYYTGRAYDWEPNQRFFFNKLLPMEEDEEEFYPGHKDFLKKFIQKKDIVLSHFPHLFKYLFLKKLEEKGEGGTPFTEALNILRARVYSEQLAIPLLTTDLELSQAFLEAVSEDKF